MSLSLFHNTLSEHTTSGKEVSEKLTDNTTDYSITNNQSLKTNLDSRSWISRLVKSPPWDQENMTFYPTPYQLDQLNGTTKNLKFMCQNSTLNESYCTTGYYYADGINEVKTVNISTGDSICTNGGINETDCLPAIPRITVTILDVAIAVFLSLFIICIIIGNILVVSSVVFFRDMRTLTNALIVSLAVADLLVALIVLPISLHYEITDHVWTLGPIICDFWITSDVFCCTASILNIVVIAMDRYWLITRNVRYTHSVRFPRKRVCIVMVTLAWVLSLIISISPLLGWNSGHEKQKAGQCLISQDLGYTIFSTFGAFWFPLSVILITYFKIFKIARKRAQSRAKSRSICPSVNTSTFGTDVMNSSLRNGKNSDPIDANRCSLLNKRLLENNDNENIQDTNNTQQNEDEPPGDKQENCYTTVNNNTYMETSINSPVPMETEKFTELNDTTNIQCKRYSNDDSTVENNCKDPRKNSTTKSNGNHTRLKRSSTNFTKNSYFRGKGRRQFQRLGQCRSSRMRYRNRMRSSARTLGLIIGCFVICWMPFFIIATVIPFCPICNDRIPAYVFSIGLWLGYSNSLFNPAIYAIWDKNFRRSFKKVLKCHINWSYII